MRRQESARRRSTTDDADADARGRRSARGRASVDRSTAKPRHAHTQYFTTTCISLSNIRSSSTRSTRNTKRREEERRPLSLLSRARVRRHVRSPPLTVRTTYRSTDPRPLHRARAPRERIGPGFVVVVVVAAVSLAFAAAAARAPEPKWCGAGCRRSSPTFRCA